MKGFSSCIYRTVVNIENEVLSGYLGAKFKIILGRMDY